MDAIPRQFRHGRIAWEGSPRANYFSHCSLSKRGSSLHFEYEAKNDAKRKIVTAMDLPASQEDYPIRPVDQLVLDLLRREEGLSIQDLMERLEVTATAIRQRVDRLENTGYIERRKIVLGRGRPSYSYYLTDKGWRQAGVSYRDLAIALWSMIQSLDSSESKSKLVHGVADRLGEMYRTEFPDASLGMADVSLEDRMRILAGLLSDRKVPSCLATGPADLPILEVHACPYPDLVSEPHDRSACHLEEMALSTALGHPVELSKCRLDGHGCCQFTPRAVPGPEAGVTAAAIASSPG
jgi:predicted ArsR family transcriptional regulator